MRRIAAALTLTALVLAGCGGDDDDATPDPVDPTTTAPRETTDPAADPTADAPTEGDGSCPYVTTAVLDEAFGTTFEELAGAEAGCSFSGPDGLSVQLSRIDIQIDPETYAEEATASCDEGTLVEVEAGDRAYACAAIGPSASFYEGDVLINLGVLSTDDEQAVIDAFVEILPDITV